MVVLDVVNNARHSALFTLNLYLKNAIKLLRSKNYSITTWDLDLETLYSVIPALYKIVHSHGEKDHHDHYDLSILERLVDLMNDIGEARSER